MTGSDDHSIRKGPLEWEIHPPSDRGYFVRIRRVGEELHLNTFDGWFLVVDLATGHLKEKEFVK